MKIDVRLETIGGQLVPVLFFPDDVERNKTISCYSLREGHNSASRAYMRDCKKPEKPEEFIASYRLIIAYYNEALSYSRIL
jgi:hypothetical protein